MKFLENVCSRFLSIKVLPPRSGYFRFPKLGSQKERTVFEELIRWTIQSDNQKPTQTKRQTMHVVSLCPRQRLFTSEDQSNSKHPSQGEYPGSKVTNIFPLIYTAVSKSRFYPHPDCLFTRFQGNACTVCNESAPEHDLILAILGAVT